MVNFGPLAAEVGSLVWGTPATFNGFRVLAALLHDTRVVGVSQSLRRWTQGATYIRKGGHHVGHWPTLYCSYVAIVLYLCCWLNCVKCDSYGPPCILRQFVRNENQHSVMLRIDVVTMMRLKWMTAARKMHT